MFTEDLSWIVEKYRFDEMQQKKPVLIDLVRGGIFSAVFAMVVLENITKLSKLRLL